MERKNLVILVDVGDFPGYDQIIDAATRILQTLTWSDKVGLENKNYIVLF